MNASTTIPRTTLGNTWTPLQIFTSGLLSLASSTIGDGTQAGGLTISGGATTTGNAYFGGNVGIGTNAPSAFAGYTNFTIATSSSGANFDFMSGTTRRSALVQQNGVFQIATLDSTPLDLQANAATVMRLTPAGNVGIGNTGPSTKLEVGSSAGQNTLRVTGNVTSNQAPVLSLYRTGSAEWTIGGGGSAVGDLSIGVNPANYNDTSLVSAAKLTITNVGNVGIGTTNPGANLHVEGTNNGEVGIRNRNWSTGSSAYSILRLYNDTANPVHLSLNSSGRSTDGGTNNATLRNDAGKLNLQGSNATGITIDTSGNVGIGTTSPRTLLFGGTAANQFGLEPRTDRADIGGAGGANLVRLGGYYNGNPIPGSAISFAAQGAAGQRGAIGFSVKATDDSTNQFEQAATPRETATRSTSPVLRERWTRRFSPMPPVRRRASNLSVILRSTQETQQCPPQISL